MIDLDFVKDNLHREGNIVNKRVSLLIKRESTVYEDYGKGACVCCGDPLPRYKRKYCSDECGEEYRIETAEYIYIWWQNFRTAILKRDNHTCGECNHKSYSGMDVHHIVPLHSGGEEFNPDNCITLCNRHHRAKHQKRNLEPTPDSHQSKLEVEI